MAQIVAVGYGRRLVGVLVPELNPYLPPASTPREDARPTIYAPRQILLAGLLGGPMAGSLLLALNRWALRQPGRALLLVGAGMALTSVLLAIPVRGLIGFLIATVGSAVIAFVQSAVMAEMEDGRLAELKEPTASSWSVVMLVTLPFLGIALLNLLGKSLLLLTDPDFSGWSS